MFYKKNGKYYCSERERAVIYKPWPDTRAYLINKKNNNFMHYFPGMADFNMREWMKVKTKSKYEYLTEKFPMFLYSYPSTLLKDSRIRREYTEHIPSGVRGAVKKYRANHWSVLTFLNRTDTEMALQMVNSSPMLALCIANAHLFRDVKGNRCRTMRMLLKKKRKYILKYLGFPGKNWILNLFEKLDDRDRHLKVIMHLRNALDNADDYTLKRFKHIRFIDKQFLYLIEFYSNLITHDFINEFLYLDEGEQFRANRKIDETNNLRNMYGSDMKKYHSLEYLQEEHGRYITISNIREMISMKNNDGDVPFPDPPIKGNDIVRPVKTVKQLNKYAIRFQNCASGYRSDIMNRRYYLYVANLNNESAMASIRIRRFNDYKLEEIRGYKNRAVSDELKNKVKKWYENETSIPF